MYNNIIIQLLQHINIHGIGKFIILKCNGDFSRYLCWFMLEVGGVVEFLISQNEQTEMSVKCIQYHIMCDINIFQQYNMWVNQNTSVHKGLCF